MNLERPYAFTPPGAPVDPYGSRLVELLIAQSVQILLNLVFSQLVAQQIHLLLALEIPYLLLPARRVLLALDAVEL